MPALAATLLALAPLTGDGWPQWGGPARDFRLAAAPLADVWPAGGPPVLWERELPRGAGHGGLAIADGRVFTLLRRGGEDVALALRLDDGAVLWEEALRAPVTRPREDGGLDYGTGPFTTPTVHGRRVFFLGATGLLRCHDAATGALLWRLALDERWPTRAGRGHGANPLVASDGTLVVQVGSPEAAALGLDPRTGKVRWESPGADTDYASPIEVAGDLFVHLEGDVAVLATEDGARRWSRPSRSDRTRHVITPLDLGPRGLLASTTYGVECLGARDGAERWSSRRIRAQVGNLLHDPVRGLVLGASSCNADALLVALDDVDGETLWRDRGVDCGFLWLVGGRLLGLAADGDLTLSEATREGLSVLARSQVLDGPEVWSAPAMDGTRLVVKGDRRLVALELGSGE